MGDEAMRTGDEGVMESRPLRNQRGMRMNLFNTIITPCPSCTKMYNNILQISTGIPRVL